MASSPEVAARRLALEREAPIVERTAWKRVTWNGRDVIFLCGTLGTAFDAWQRRLSVLSAADALISQQIGLDAIERTMDNLESELRRTIESEGACLRPRRSPGYGDLSLDLSRDIIAALDATRRIGVSVTDSGLLVPSKSVTAICEIVKGEGE